MITISYDTMQATYAQVLGRFSLGAERTASLAAIFADNTRDGVTTHGIDRFPSLVRKLTAGLIDPVAVPTLTAALGAFEQWDGNNGIGPLNAMAMVERAMRLADEHGVGLTVIRHTNHWMRGATYGYRSAEQGYPCICWTNTIPNLAPWGTTTEVLGNNPIVFAMPGTQRAVVLDMAISQFSYGKLHSTAAAGKQLPAVGGFDRNGQPTTDARAILDGGHVLPIGFYKGSGLALMLDLFASVLSQGASTAFMHGEEGSICQLFLAIHPGATEAERTERSHMVEQVLDSLKATCAAHGEVYHYPGEGSQRSRAKSVSEGISVDEKAWQAVLDLNR